MTYDGAISAGGAFFTGGSRGAGRSGLTGAASGAGLTAGSFATFLAAGAGGAGKADVTLDRRGGQHHQASAQAPPRRRRWLKGGQGRPGAKWAKAAAWSRLEPCLASPRCQHPPAPPLPPHVSPLRGGGHGQGHGTHGGAGGSNSSSSTRETSSTLQGRDAGVRLGAASWHLPWGPGPGDHPLAEGHYREPRGRWRGGEGSRPGVRSGCWFGGGESNPRLFPSIPSPIRRHPPFFRHHLPKGLRCAERHSRTFWGARGRKG